MLIAVEICRDFMPDSGICDVDSALVCNDCIQIGVSKSSSAAHPIGIVDKQINVRSDFVVDRIRIGSGDEKFGKTTCTVRRFVVEIEADFSKSVVIRNVNRNDKTEGEITVIDGYFSVKDTIFLPVKGVLGLFCDK